MREPGTTRAIAVASLVALLLLVGAIVLFGGGGSSHRVYLEAPAARFIVSGLDVKAAGQTVGKVTDTEVTRDNKALLKLRIDDDAVWPLPEGTTARFRFAGTVKMSARYVELDPPAQGGRAIPDGGLIRAVDVTSPEDYVSTPQEFDDVFRIFGSRTRHNLKATLDKGGAALQAAQPGLRRVLDRTPPAAAQIAGVFEDLGYDTSALDRLTRSSDRVVAAIDSSNPGIARLLQGAGTTFAALGEQSRELERAVARMPATLTTTRRVLAHADRTLTATHDLVRQLPPGVGELHKLAPPLEGVLRRLVRVSPDLRQTFSTLRRATPVLNPFLDRATGLMPAIRSVGLKARPELHCIRPYSPELVSLIQTWTGYWGGTKGGEGTDTFARTGAGSFPFPNGTPLSAGELVKAFPSLRYAFPMPPGEIIGQPWFIPECGYTKDSLDPSKDPEATAFDPLSRKFVQFAPPSEADGGPR